MYVCDSRYVVDVRELRHASIHLLLSMFSLPLHFLHQPIPGEPPGSPSHLHKHIYKHSICRECE